MFSQDWHPLLHASFSMQEDVRTQHADFPTSVVFAEGRMLHSNVTGGLVTEGLLSSLMPQTQIDVSYLAYLLRDYPFPVIVDYIVQGLRHGFDIGFHGPVVSTNPRNLRSSIAFRQEITDAIAKEVSRGHTAGPFPSAPFAPFHCSPLGAVPKKDGSARIILDLSSPRGLSINEGISHDLFSVKYASFDEAVDLVKPVGPSCFLAKIDIKHAFRLCPVKPAQWPLLGYFWENQFNFDMRLPFGSRSSPFIFNTLADLLLWILIFVSGIPHIIHYLDDFLIVASSKDDCSTYMGSMFSMFSRLGVPIAVEKTVGPSQIVTYLGIVMDTVRRELRLPHEKLVELLNVLRGWSSVRKCTKRELLSLIGSLSFAAKVVKPGRMFLRRLIDLSTTVRRLDHHITLNAGSKADIQWWLDFLPGWNGVCMMQSEIITSPTISLFTDASDLGCGALYGDRWFSLPFPPKFVDHHISIRELFAIVAAVYTWGVEWENKQILIFTDNEAITHVWRTGRSKDPMIMNLVRFLFLFAARHNINILLQHIRGYYNLPADLLSRLQVARFRRVVPSACQNPELVPPEVLTWLT